jgi:hypothetical protein
MRKYYACRYESKEANIIRKNKNKIKMFDKLLSVEKKFAIFVKDCCDLDPDPVSVFSKSLHSG